MGASTFTMTAKAKTADAAFEIARNGDRHDPMADKVAFVMFTSPVGVDAEEHAMALTMNANTKLTKWGPAGCIQTAPGEFLFFGWFAD